MSFTIKSSETAIGVLRITIATPPGASPDSASLRVADLDLRSPDGTRLWPATAKELAARCRADRRKYASEVLALEKTTSRRPFDPADVNPSLRRLLTAFEPYRHSSIADSPDVLAIVRGHSALQERVKAEEERQRVGLPARNIAAASILGQSRARVRNSVGVRPEVMAGVDNFQIGSLRLWVKYSNGKAFWLVCELHNVNREVAALRRWLQLTPDGPISVGGRFYRSQGVGEDTFVIEDYDQANAAVGEERAARLASLPSLPSASAGDERRISARVFGCEDREYYEKLAQYLRQNDDEAFGRGLAAGLPVGRCTMFEAGEVVYIADTAFFSGAVRVRRKGQTQEFWTLGEAVQ